MTPLSLICGDPSGKPATYTRFILPVVYDVKKLEHSANTEGNSNVPLFYRPATSFDWILKDEIWRRKYLTNETENCLFNRATWWVIEGWNWSSEFCFKDTRKILVSMSPPSLVLFEQLASRGGDDRLSVGFLFVQLHFPSGDDACPTLDNLLELNELFRYWQKPFDGHEEGYTELLANCPLSANDPGRTVGGEPGPEIYLERWASLLNVPLRDAEGNMWRLFPEDWANAARTYARESFRGSHPRDRGWMIYADSRAFVWTCAILEDGGGTLRQQFRVPNAKPWDLGHWIKLLNIDPPEDSPRATHNKVMEYEKKWAKKRTYCRWEERGTFYGFNYHCGAMLGPPLNEPNDPPIWRHFGGMYFDQVLLLLYLRVVLFRFSMKLNEISSSARQQDMTDGQQKWQDEFRDLRWNFALFANLYQFPLLSNQQQGIEMYTIARQYMDVDQLFREIQQEIEGSHNYLEVWVASEQTRLVTGLTVVATIGLLFGLTSSILGMNILITEGKWRLLREWEKGSAVLLIVLALLVLTVWQSEWIARWLKWLSGRGWK